MDNLNGEIYLEHKKYIKIIILREMESSLSEIFSFLISGMNIKEEPQTCIWEGPDETSMTVQWMFSNIIGRKWINIEPKISARLRRLLRQNKLIAFNITWV